MLAVSNTNAFGIGVQSTTKLLFQAAEYVWYGLGVPTGTGAAFPIGSEIVPELNPFAPLVTLPLSETSVMPWWRSIRPPTSAVSRRRIFIVRVCNVGNMVRVKSDKWALSHEGDAKKDSQTTRSHGGKV